MPVRSRPISQDLSQGTDGQSAESSRAAPLDLNWTLRILRRNAILVAGVVAAFLALAMAYLAIATPLYTATGELIFDLREPKIVSNNPILQSFGADQYVIDSQVEVVRSLSVARRVINQLDLRQKAATSGLPLWRRWLDFGGTVKPVSEDIPQSDYEAFLRRLTVQRKGVSFVILVSYSHPDPVKAAAITNAVMDAYTSEQKRVKVETISAANNWLQSRVDELRLKVIEAERRVQQFKTEDAAIDAKVMNAIYATFLTRLKETQQQEALQSSDARIVSSAVAPTQPSSPKKFLTMALALALGLSLASLVAIARGLLDPVLHDADDVGRTTDVPILVELPYRNADELQKLSEHLERDRVSANEEAMDADDAPGLRRLRPQDSAYGQALFTLRQALIDSTQLDSHRLVAIVSPRSGEGKTTTAINFAREAAAAGTRTLLVDADLRSGAASELMASGDRERSLVDYIYGAATLKDTVTKDTMSPAMICPAPVAERAVDRPTDVIAGRGFFKAARDMRKDFDLVVFDTPGFLDYPDSRALLRAVDRVVVVVDLGQTTRQDLSALIAIASSLPQGIAGIALNTSGNRRAAETDPAATQLASKLPWLFERTRRKNRKG